MTDAGPAGVRVHSIEANGLRFRVAEAGDGPLVLLLHGFPEGWYSWRHQLPALAGAGYRAVAPDMRGYGGSDAPLEVEAYDVERLVGDAEALVAALGDERAVLIGHDWGAIIAWQAALLAPERFRAVVGMSVPYTGRPDEAPLATWRRRFGEDFFYILYFQTPGVAEAEFEANRETFLRRLYSAGGAEPAAPPEITERAMRAGGWIGRLPEPRALPEWLSPDDIAHFVAAFERSGFRGPVSYYRNFDRNWELTPQLSGRRVRQPAMFLAGARDPVIAPHGIMGVGDRLEQRMREAVADLRRFVVLPGAGHWIQQERPDDVNREMLAFLRDLDAEGG